MINRVSLLYNTPIVSTYKSKNQQTKPVYCTESISLSDSTVGRAILAQRNISFKKVETVKNVNKNMSLELNLTDEKIQPKISMEIKPNGNIPTKQGLGAIYSFALEDQINNNMDAVGKVNLLALEVTPNGRKISLSCDNNNFSNTILALRSSFMNAEISEEFVNNAKQIASTALFLSRRTGDYKEYFKDIPANMPEEVYEKMISEIGYEDIQKHNDLLINNSNVSISLTMNKDDYQNNKHIFEE